MNEHRGRVALLISEFAMRYRGLRGDGTASLRAGARLPQPDNQVFDELREMPGTVFITKRKEIEVSALLCPSSPFFEETPNPPPQYRTDSFMFWGSCFWCHPVTSSDGLATVSVRRAGET